METEIKKKKSILALIIAASAVVLLISVIIVMLLFSNNSRREVRKQLDLGSRYLSELNFDKAAAAFRDAVRIDPEDEDALELFHECYLRWMEHDTGKAYEIFEAERNTLNAMLAEAPSERIEELLIKVGELLVQYAPDATEDPNNMPTQAAKATATPAPAPDGEDDRDRFVVDDWKDVDFSEPVTQENAQAVLDRLVAEEKWDYNGDGRCGMICSDLYDESGFMGVGFVNVVTYDDIHCLEIYIPLRQHEVGGPDQEIRQYEVGEATLQEIYEEISGL